MAFRSPSEQFSKSRRRFFVVPPLLLLAGCDYQAGEKTEGFLRGFQKFNDWFQGAVFDPSKLAPEYADDQLTPEEGFRVNDYDTDTPEIDVPNW